MRPWCFLQCLFPEIIRVPLLHGLFFNLWVSAVITNSENDSNINSTQYLSWSVVKYFGSHLTDNIYMFNCSWIINPTYFLHISRVSAFLLAEICQSAKLRSWTWSAISRVNTVEHLSNHAAFWISKIFTMEIDTPLHHSWVSQEIVTNVCIMHTWISFGGFFFYRSRNFMMAHGSRLENSKFSVDMIQFHNLKPCQK